MGNGATRKSIEYEKGGNNFYYLTASSRDYGFEWNKRNSQCGIK